MPLIRWDDTTEITTPQRGWKMPSWKRLATFVAGGALSVVGVLVPATGAVLVPAGAVLIGWATRWPGDTPKPKKSKEPQL